MELLFLLILGELESAVAPTPAGGEHLWEQLAVALEMKFEGSGAEAPGGAGGRRERASWEEPASGVLRCRGRLAPKALQREAHRSPARPGDICFPALLISSAFVSRVSISLLGQEKGVL